MRLRPLAVALFFVLNSGCSSLTREKRVREPVTADYATGDLEFRDTFNELLGAPLVEGNAVVELLNGDRIFDSMLQAIGEAKKTITMENYIWSSGKVSDRFIEALSARARADVKVTVLLDGVGGVGLKKRDREKLKQAGVRLAKFNPPLSFKFFRANLRTHRKILVVDGRVGFTGGVCISDDWQGDAQKPFWRDTHLRVEGPVVGQMQAVIMENWLQATSQALHGGDYFPQPKRAGGMTAQFVKSGYKDAAENTRLSYLLSFAAARKNIRIAHAYFAPDTQMIDTLLAALKRGVKIEIIVPKKNDNIAVDKASRPRWTKLLEAGAHFFAYEKTLYHCKIVIVDDAWSTIGSVNFDERSFRLNDEANLNVLDRGFAAKLVETFERDKRDSKPLTKDDLKKRGFFGRLADHFFGLFRAQL